MLDSDHLHRPPIYRFDYLGLIYGRRLVQRLLRDECGEPAGRLAVLDVGSGAGAWAPVLRPYAADYCGLDLVAGPSVTLVASAEKMPLPDDRFDLVFSNAVLEHVRDYRAAVAEMHRVVKPDGVVILGTHGTWEIHGAPHDYWRWTPFGLRETFAAFADIRIVQAGGPAMNDHLFRNLYLRRWQEKHPRWRGLLSPLIAWHNLLGARDGDRTEPPATLAAFYYVVARKRAR